MKLTSLHSTNHPTTWDFVSIYRDAYFAMLVSRILSYQVGFWSQRSIK